MKKHPYVFVILVLWLMLLWQSVAAQTPIPIDVFAEHDRNNETLTLYFTNPVSGLSTPVTINGFPQNAVATDEFAVTAAGVIFKNPTDRHVMLVTPDGRITPHPFIPQQTEGLVTVDWTVSPDRQSIAWVEVFPAEDRWVSNVFTADINGTAIVALPPSPASGVDPFGRVKPLSLTNDRNLLFYDAAFPVENRPITDYFADYRDVQVYIASRNVFQQLPGEPVCNCGVGIGGNGRTFLRLSNRNPGYNLTWWNLDTNTSEPIPFVRPAFGQAGDFFVPESSPLAFYTVAENLEDTTQSDNQFALMMIDFTTRTQRLLIEPNPQRFRAMSVLDGNTILVVDVYGGATYKLNLLNGQLALVAENTWLGTVFLP